MPDYGDFIAAPDPARPRLYLNRLRNIVSPGTGRRLGYDSRGHTGLWVDAPGRKRAYVCSMGVRHTSYWRRHQNGGGAPIDMRCDEHEVVLF